MYLNWGNWDFNSRVTATDNLIYCFGILSMSTDIMFKPNTMKSFMDLIYSEFTVYRVPLKNTENDIYERKCELVDEMTLEGYRLLKSTGTVLRYFFSGYSIVPICGILFYFLNLEPVENLPLLFKFYSPLSLSLTVTSFHEYLVCTGLQLFYVYYSVILALINSLSQMLTMFHMRVEMKLFQLNVREINMYCAENTFRVNKNESYGLEDNGFSEKELRLMMKQLARHHQIICRKMDWLNEGFKIRLFYFNTFICLQICLGIFIVLKGQIVLKIKYFIIVISIAVIEFFLSENGQKVQDEGEEIRTVLYECDWRGKPKWFTSSLQLIMTRSNRLPRIYLFNVMTLNRKNMMVVMRGAYSYLNLLNNFSK
ncbi:uncharacterized protein LOC120349445 [Nilaparvata lugens]|uniref:uncharacterized protein LOC120349445 n=1 Tax=Nilaparvata lugens TaxID=108931 RepID=UPI00193E7CCF|nr:uncharacterized protein LOC120349445 [Nilaparvata lugens]